MTGIMQKPACVLRAFFQASDHVCLEQQGQSRLLAEARKFAPGKPAAPGG